MLFPRAIALDATSLNSPWHNLWFCAWGNVQVACRVILLWSSSLGCKNTQTQIAGKNINFLQGKKVNSLWTHEGLQISGCKLPSSLSLCLPPPLPFLLPIHSLFYLISSLLSLLSLFFFLPSSFFLPFYSHLFIYRFFPLASYPLILSHPFRRPFQLSPSSSIVTSLGRIPATVLSEPQRSPSTNSVKYCGDDNDKTFIPDGHHILPVLEGRFK